AGGVEDAKHLPVGLAGESVETDLVLPNMRVRVDHDLLAHPGKGGNVTRGHLHLVADPAHLYAEGVLTKGNENPAKPPDHRAASSGATRRWQRAIASASAASAGVGGAASFRSRATMACTWLLSADPSPVT